MGILGGLECFFLASSSSFLILRIADSLSFVLLLFHHSHEFFQNVQSNILSLSICGAEEAFFEEL